MTRYLAVVGAALAVAWIIYAARNWKRWRRRRPGIYAYRGRRHLTGGREWLYVGQSKHEYLRHLDHAGQGNYGKEEKPWFDLVDRRMVLRLPWWLGFTWILLAIEAVAIRALRPRYNLAGNPRRSKVGPRLAADQRAQRDSIRWGNSSRGRSRSR